MNALQRYVRAAIGLLPRLQDVFAAVAGQVDHANDRILRGWAWAPHAPKRRLVLDVLYRGIFLGQAVAGAYRGDLEAHGIGDGRHAFIFHLPDDVPRSFAASDLIVATAGPIRRTLPMSAELAPGKSRSRRLPGHHRSLLGPYLAALCRDADPSPAMMRMDRRPRIDVLCAEVPDVGLSAFLVHTARKYGRSVKEEDQPAFLRWYLDTYATERGPKRAPLSRCDLARLREARPASVVAELAASEIDAADPDATYRWAAEVSCRLFVDDCLVGDDQKAALRSLAAAQLPLPFPLSNFMRVLCSEVAVLRRFRMDRERDRKAIYVLLLILALRRPSIVNYLPAAWVKRLLDDEAMIGGVLRWLFDDGPPSAASALIARLGRSGIAAADASWSPDGYEGSRILGGSSVMAGPAEFDVQIIGPFSRRMGLGESCRRIARALAATSLSVNLVDHVVGSAGADVAADLRPGPVRPEPVRPSRLNILHLNLEQIPEALAYLPDAFSGTPTVAIPYWELSRPAAVHRLGLATVDEVWAASRFMAGVFADAGPPVHWIGMSCDQTPTPGRDRCLDLRRRHGIGASTFMVLTTSDARSGVQRKNPLGVIRAFQAAFGADDVTLVVKTHSVGAVLSDEQKSEWREVVSLCEGDRRIAFIDASFDGASQRTLLAAADCFVTLHRAEGLGLDALDALWMGVPVVATDYSGVTDLCTPDTAWMVEAERVAVDPRDYGFAEPGHLWAAPSQAAAAAALRSVYADPQERRRRIEAARRLVSEVATVEAFAERLERRVRHLLDRPPAARPA